MNRDILISYIALLITAAIAGAISGILYFDTMGMRAAILGVSLALGVIAIDSIEQKRFVTRQAPRNIVVLGAAMVSGLVGGVLVNLYGMGFSAPRRYDFGPDPTPAGMETIAVSIMYALCLHIAYALRWKISDDKKKSRFISILGLFAGAGVLSTIARNFIQFLNLESIGERLWEGLLMSLFTGIPFALLWGTAVVFTDPAWSHERFIKFRK